MSYQREFSRSIEKPEEFWAEKAQALEWITPPEKILSTDEKGLTRWFAGGVLNTSWLCLDRHVLLGRGKEPALIHDSPVTRTRRVFSFAELRDRTARFAGALAALGVGRGDRVVIYMPMVPEAVVAMLACARIGAIHSVVFGGFAPHELAVRIDDARPKVVVSASCGIEFAKVIPYKPLLDKAMELARHKPRHCVILQRPQAGAALVPGRDLDWEEAVGLAQPAACVPVAATDPLYILYTSGTTGRPKGIVRDNGGHAVALAWSMGAIYGVGPGDVFWAASDVGWVVGHSYIVYGPLLAGCATVLYEGKPVRTPDAGAFWRVMAEHRVKSFFTAPTAFRAVRKEDPEGRLAKAHDLSSLSCVYLAGERLDPSTYHWLKGLLGLPVVDHWWQTETGWPIAANPMGLEPMPEKPGSATLPVPGFDVRVLDEDGRLCPPGQSGNVAIRLPLPPGCLPTLWNDDERFCSSYLARYPGFYLTGDGGFTDEDGYLSIMGRTDDVINVAGHRLSTGEIEELVAGHPAVAECAVIGVADEMKGQVPAGFAVLKDGAAVEPAALEAELVARVREEIGAFACFRRVAVVPRLPKTRSGKILRGIMRKIADGLAYAVPSTIDDPAILDELRQEMAASGIGTPKTEETVAQ